MLQLVQPRFMSISNAGFEDFYDSTIDDYHRVSISGIRGPDFDRED